MPRGFVLLLVSPLILQDPTEDVRAALRKTAGESYSYKVSGKHDRTGEFKPPGLLTSRIRQYQSARQKDQILVKGPEGLWKTPGERLGEKTENPDRDAPEIVRTLQDAEPPHKMVEDLLASVKPMGEPQDREVGPIPCRRYLFSFRAEALKTSLEQQMTKAVAAGAMQRPHEIRWSSAKGTLGVYADRQDGRLVKVFDERSVKFVTQTPNGPDVRTYKVEMDYEFSGWGRAVPALPPEVRERLGLKDE